MMFMEMHMVRVSKDIDDKTLICIGFEGKRSSSRNSTCKNEINQSLNKLPLLWVPYDF